MRFVLLLIVALSSLFQTLSYAASSCEQDHCMIIADVGSSGTRVHLFSYDLDKTNTPVEITERWTKKIKPGFSTLDLNAATIDSYLTVLFSDAPVKDLPVFFYATAGMRLLPQRTQQQYYKLVQAWFNSQPEWNLISAKTITGSEEGLYGWLSVNYQLGKLQDNSDPVGVLDMGGASVEITLPVKNTQEMDTADLKEIDVYGHHFKIFTHSFLGLGQTEITHQYLDSPACFMNNYILPSGGAANGDAYTCEEQISSLMNTVHGVNTTVQPVINENPVATWYAIGGGLIDMVNTKPFHFSDQAFTNQELLQQANAETCHQQWSTLETQYPNNEYLYGYCLYPSYYYSLIVDGYGIQPEQPINYLNPNQSADWAIGVILQQNKVLHPN